MYQTALISAPFIASNSGAVDSAVNKTCVNVFSPYKLYGSAMLYPSL